MKNRKLILIGGGGHCRSVLDSILESNEFDHHGIIDSKDNIGNKILGVEVIGTDEDLPKLFEDGYTDAFITMGSIGNTKLRRKLFSIIESIGYNIPVIIDSTAKVSSYANVKRGVFVGKGAIINAGANIDELAIINTGSIIEHDTSVGKFCHISPGTVLCGGVKIEDDSHIGAGAIVKQGVRIGHNSLVGMGSVVVKDIEASSLAYGNPCIIKSKRDEVI